MSHGGALDKLDKDRVTTPDLLETFKRPQQSLETSPGESIETSTKSRDLNKVTAKSRDLNTV